MCLECGPQPPKEHNHSPPKKTAATNIMRNTFHVPYKLPYVQPGGCQN